MSNYGAMRTSPNRTRRRSHRTKYSADVRNFRGAITMKCADIDGNICRHHDCTCQLFAPDAVFAVAAVAGTRADGWDARAARMSNRSFAASRPTPLRRRSIRSASGTSGYRRGGFEVGHVGLLGNTTTAASIAARMTAPNNTHAPAANTMGAFRNSPAPSAGTPPSHPE
jgi:hypothetical protein